MPSVPCRYGFVVYQDANVTDIACAGLNGMRMGERTLTVRRATEVRLPAQPGLFPCSCMPQVHPSQTRLHNGGPHMIMYAMVNLLKGHQTLQTRLNQNRLSL